MIRRSLTGSLLAVLFAISGNAEFEIRGSRLYLDGSPFPIRGVAYSPTPVGEIPTGVLRLSGCVYNRDFPLMARAGINTVRIYGRVPAGERFFWQALEKNSLYLLAGFPLDPYYDPSATLAPGSSLRARILADFREYAEQLRSSRRVMAVVFGNEVSSDYNRKFAGAPRDFYSLVDEAAASGLLLTTAVADVADVAADAPGVSFWSLNVSRGSLAGLLDEVRRRTGRAVLVSEFGVDAFDNGRQVEDAGTQATVLRSLARQLRVEMDRAGSTLLGGVWLGWSDEWWRGGPDPSRHGTAGELRSGFPDGVSNPAWFGLFGVTATEIPGLDSLRPRPAFAALAEEWGSRLPADWPPKPPRLAPQGVVNAAGQGSAIAPGGLMSLFGEDLADTPARSLESPLPLQADWTSACIGSRPVPLLSVDAGQINGQAPWETPFGSAPVVVYRAGAASNIVTVGVREFAPGILDRGVIPAGRPCPVSVASGVRPGTYVEIYGTGLGSASSSLLTGMAPLAPRPLDALPRSFLGSRELRVLYSGLVPGLVGIYQTNIQVPEDFPPGSPMGLRLLAGGVESNSYPITVLSDADQPRYTLGDGALSYVVQPGGPPQTAELSIEGQNGFCELVRFAVAGLPDGVGVALPVAFPGQRIPVTVQAAPHARGDQDLVATIRGFSLAAENPTARLRVTVLPSRGDIAFRVVSGGGRAGLIARFEMAGRLLYEARGGGAGRGFNFLVLNGDTGVLGPARKFDTWLSEAAAEEMADYLSALPVGTVVLGAIADEGTLHLTPRARTALRTLLRSQFLDTLRYQDSWAILTRIGAALPIAEDQASDRQVVLERVLTFPMP
ncbi:MAG: hypothetical protein HY238_04320 [Acidobacteria bacterium]|nr:hypothetical protein [Acidobacteriota bacterium]